MEDSRAEQFEELRWMNSILVRLYVLGGMVFAAIVGGGIWVLRCLLNL